VASQGSPRVASDRYPVCSRARLACNCLRIDELVCPRVALLREEGVLLRARFQRAILILGLAVVALGFIVPRGDDPGTAFDERDTPVNQVTSVVPRSDLAPPTRLSLIALHPLRFEYEIRTSQTGTSISRRVRDIVE